MTGFTKLFGQIVNSSIWDENHVTRIVWVTMLALAGPDGVVRAAIPGLANASRVTLEECEAALDKFQQPDKYSRSQEHDGRRIQRVEGGFLLLNYQRYRNELDQERRREYKRNKQALYRSKPKRKATPIAGSAGEQQYVKAVESGASERELDDIVTRNLPEELREQPAQYSV